MARYHVTHTCGHEQTHNIAGKVADRQGKEGWLASQLCRDCQHKAEFERASKISAKRELPALTGSDAQIQWAETIRANALKDFDKIRKYLEHGRANAVSAAEEAEATDTLKKAAADAIGMADSMISIINNTLSEGSSKFWIDSRFTDFNRRWIIEQYKKTDSSK